MDTSIYIGNEKMQLVCGKDRRGKVEIETFAEVELPAGAVLNGIVTNEELFVNAFRQLMTEHPDLKKHNMRIAIGGGQIFTKTTTAPKVSEQKMLEWIKGEFGDLESEEEFLYDYRILKPGKDGDLALLCAAEKAGIGEYVELFDDLGVEIDCIDAGLNCQIKMLNFLPETEDATFIFVTLDGNNLDASIYVDGMFKISNRTRLFGERGDESISPEIERMISTLTQFYRAEQYEGEVSTIYICGCRRDELFVIKNIAERFEIMPKILRDEENLITIDIPGFRLDEYLYAVGNLLEE